MDLIRSENGRRNGKAGLASPQISSLATGGLALLALFWSTDVHAEELAAHRAVYELQLSEVKTSADVGALSGRMVLEWDGNSCDGYTLSQRLVTEIVDTDGRAEVTDVRMTSWESADGDQFRFEVQQFAGLSLVNTISGFADRSESPLVASFTEPGDLTLQLPQDIIFPSEFMKNLVEAAQAGETLFSAPVFEGAETDKYFLVSSFIGKPSVAEIKEVATDGEGLALESASSWPVQVSYFLPNAKEGLPEYQVSYRLYDNGVSSNLVLDYGDIVINGTLTELTYLVSDPC
ncbi:MAG: cell envelope integrity EipB family protein [Rhodobiaceae bacterium]|nr:cell envelope integrity EipB family protein [Rhodobiaceae bacterium]